AAPGRPASGTGVRQDDDDRLATRVGSVSRSCQTHAPPAAIRSVMIDASRIRRARLVAPEVPVVRPRGRSADILYWLLAIVAGVVAMGLRTLFDEAVVGDALPYLFAYPAVALVGLLVGSGPALATMTASTVWVLVPWVPPTATGTWLETLIFVPMATVLAVAAARYSDRRGAASPIPDS